MAGIDVVRFDEAVASGDHPVSGHRVVGAASLRLVCPADGPLWLVCGVLEDGTQLEPPARHGDEAVYVRSGALAVNDRLLDRRCPPLGAVIVERAANVTITAVGRTEIVHVGPTDLDVASTDVPGGHVHVVGPRGTYAAVEPGRDTHYYADSTCPSCRITLLYTSRSVEYVSDTHSHSADELIHLLWGEVRLGNQVMRPGDTLAVAADRRYGFRSGPDGFGFLNYRQGPSQQIVARGSAPRMEGGLVNGLVAVMDLR